MRAWIAMGAIVVVGCSPNTFGGDDGSTSSDGGGGGDATLADGADDADCGTALDKQGCACEIANQSRVCWLGTPGDASACTAGLQKCTSSMWGACSGGPPAPQETCFDGIDNDCNGKVDDGCNCAPSTQMCMPDGGTAADPTWVFVPSTLHMLVQTEVIILTKSTPTKSPTLGATHNVSTECVSTSLPCTPGSSCGGWNAIRFEYTPPTTGSYKFVVHLDDISAGSCTGSTTYQMTVNVQ